MTITMQQQQQRQNIILMHLITDCISSTRSPYFTIEHLNERKFKSLQGNIQIAILILHPLTISPLSCVSMLFTYIVLFHYLFEFPQTFIFFLFLKHDTTVLDYQTYFLLHLSTSISHIRTFHRLSSIERLFR